MSLIENAKRAAGQNSVEYAQVMDAILRNREYNANKQALNQELGAFAPKDSAKIDNLLRGINQYERNIDRGLASEWRNAQ